MSNYTKSTNFTAKDALATGNPSKVILGSEHDAEYDAIATAIASKHDTATVATAIVPGIIELATGAEALAGSDTTRAVTSAGLASDQTKAAKGHTVLPGGLLLNWGKITFSAATGPLTDTFDKAFSGTPYSMVLGNTMGNTARITTFTTTTVGITMSSSSTGDVYFWAIGPA